MPGDYNVSFWPPPPAATLFGMATPLFDAVFCFRWFLARRRHVPVSPPASVHSDFLYAACSILWVLLVCGNPPSMVVRVVFDVSLVLPQWGSGYQSFLVPHFGILGQYYC